MSLKPAPDEHHREELRARSPIEVWADRVPTFLAMTAGGVFIGGIFGLRGAIAGAILAALFGVVDATQHPWRY